MSVLIKGMKIPKRCPDCPLLEKNHNLLSGLFDIWCSLGVFEINDIDVVDINELYDKIEKSKNCPLTEVPPHGRLIDVDLITNYQMTGKVTGADGSDWGKQTYVVLPIPSLSEIPTVLEADYANY